MLLIDYMFGTGCICNSLCSKV